MEKQKNAHRLVQLALLVAVELVMTYTPLGYLHVGPLSITFLMIPVVLGAILIGPTAGAVLGGEGMIHVIKNDRELKNDAFIGCCPVGAIKKCGAIKPPVPPAPVPVGSFGAASGGAGGGRRRRRG